MTDGRANRPGEPRLATHDEGAGRKKGREAKGAHSERALTEREVGPNEAALAAIYALLITAEAKRLDVDAPPIVEIGGNEQVAKVAGVIIAAEIRKAFMLPAERRKEEVLDVEVVEDRRRGRFGIKINAGFREESAEGRFSIAAAGGQP